MRLIDSWKIGGKLRIRLICAGLLGAACTSHAQTLPAPISVAAEAGENHLRNIRQLTNGGENAEAYFSHNGKWLIFQSTRDGRTCDQQYVMGIDGSHVRRVSSGVGKTTCGYFMDGDRRILFASSQALERDCPPRTSGGSIRSTFTRLARMALDFVA